MITEGELGVLLYSWQVGQLKNIYEFVLVEESTSSKLGAKRREFSHATRLLKTLKLENYAEVSF